MKLVLNKKIILHQALKKTFSKIINVIALTYPLSDSSEEDKLLKLSLICLTIIFSMYLHSFKNTLDNTVDNNFRLS